MFQCAHARLKHLENLIYNESKNAFRSKVTGRSTDRKANTKTSKSTDQSIAPALVKHQILFIYIKACLLVLLFTS